MPTATTATAVEGTQIHRDRIEMIRIESTLEAIAAAAAVAAERKEMGPPKAAGKAKGAERRKREEMEEGKGRKGVVAVDSDCDCHHVTVLLTSRIMTSNSLFLFLLKRSFFWLIRLSQLRPYLMVHCRLAGGCWEI